MTLYDTISIYFIKCANIVFKEVIKHKKNTVILYEGNRRGLSYEERSRRGKIQSVFKLSGKRTITRQNSGKFLLLKTPMVQFLNDRKFLLGRMTELSNFIFTGKISQV